MLTAWMKDQRPDARQLGFHSSCNALLQHSINITHLFLTTPHTHTPPEFFFAKKSQKQCIQEDPGTQKTKTQQQLTCPYHIQRFQLCFFVILLYQYGYPVYEIPKLSMIKNQLESLFKYTPTSYLHLYPNSGSVELEGDWKSVFFQNPQMILMGS